MTENLIFVGDILKRAGSHKQAKLIIENEDFHTSFARVVDEVSCEFMLESISNGIVLRGSISGNFEAKCGYGLENFTESFNYSVNELFEHAHDLAVRVNTKDSEKSFANADEDDEEEDLYSYEGTDIDVTQLVVDTIMTNLPIAPVCSHGPENCSICAVDVLPYVNKNQDEEAPKLDSRWSALDDMFKDLDNEGKS